MTTTEPRGAHASRPLQRHAEQVQRETAQLDRELRRLIAEHDLPEPATISHNAPDGDRTLVIVAADDAAWEAWSAHLDSTGHVKPGPYRVGGQTLRYRVGLLAGVETVVIVDDALRVLAGRRGDVTLDADRDPDTGTAVT